MSRFVRHCPDHRLVLEEVGDSFIYPRGEHVVLSWDVVDTVKGLVVAEAGTCPNAEVKHVRRKTSLGLAPVAPSKTIEVEVLDGANFTAGQARLLIRLRRHNKYGRLRIYWIRKSQDGATVSGTSNDLGLDQEVEAKKALAAATLAAERSGWVRVVGALRGGRAVRLSPIPAP